MSIRTWGFRFESDSRTWNLLDMDWFHRFQDGKEAFPTELEATIPIALVGVDTQGDTPLRVLSTEFSFLHVDSDGRFIPPWKRPVAMEGARAIATLILSDGDDEESARNRFIRLQHQRHSFWEPSPRQLESLRLMLVEHGVPCPPDHWQALWQTEQLRHSR